MLAAIGTVEKPTAYYDADVKGFGLIARPTGARSWILEYRPGAGGRGVSKRRLVIGDPETMTPEKAREAAKDMLADIRKGKDPAAERKAERTAETVSELAERWMTEHVATKRKPGTAAFYRGVLDTHVLPTIGRKQAIKVTRQDVARLHGEIANKRRTATKAGAKRSPREKTTGGRTIANRALATIAALYSWGEGLGVLPIGTNPAKGIESYKEQGREHFLSAKEMQRLGETLRLAESKGLPWSIDESKPTAKHAPKPENRCVKFTPHVVAAIRLLLLTGCRLREVLNLEWSHVDFERGLLRLPDSKTGKKSVVLGGAALALLTDLPRLGRYVIASESAGRSEETPRRDLNRPWRAIREAAGLASTRLHDLRHSAAAVGAGAGLSLHQIGGLLGHSQARTTQRYAHLASDPQRRAADLIGNEVAAALGLSADIVKLDLRRRA
jgi:integrase